MNIPQYKVIYSPEANEDLKAIYRYIAIDLGEKGTAKNQTERIRKKIHGLTTFPEKYKAVEWKPWSEINMRQVTIDNYVAFYLVDNSKQLVTVVRIFYGGRDIQNLVTIQNNKKIVYLHKRNFEISNSRHADERSTNWSYAMLSRDTKIAS